LKIYHKNANIENKTLDELENENRAELKKRFL
jgi:hypothetical protein